MHQQEVMKEWENEFKRLGVNEQNRKFYLQSPDHAKYLYETYLHLALLLAKEKDALHQTGT